MELKYSFSNWRKKSHIVWIEPLWNWNSIGYYQGRKPWTFELNLYGIEILLLLLLHHLCRRLNWTFMELKCDFAFDALLRKIRLNWTFMELKLMIDAVWASTPAARLNWTFMELKYNIWHRNCVWPKRLNWTFMELKFWASCAMQPELLCLNWTFMELKYGTAFFCLIGLTCLNWTFMELK